MRRRSLLFLWLAAAWAGRAVGQEVTAKTLQIPRFKSDLPRVFTDISWDEKRSCFVLVNDRAMAELFMRQDAIGPGSFISPTEGFSLRGWTLVRGKGCAVDLASMTIQLALSRRKTANSALDTGGARPSALAWDGQNLWSADAGTNRIYRHDLDGDLFKTATSYRAAGDAVCGLAWDGNRLWSCDRDRLFSYDGQMAPAGAWGLPVRVSGIVWRGTELWASAEDKDVLYKLDVPTGR